MITKNELAIFGGRPALPEGIERSRWPRFSEQELEELCRVLREEQLGGSDAPQVVALEQEWSQRIGVDHCCAVGAGFPLPHRQYVFSLPIMLRVYFRNNRRLLKKLCRIANECLLEFLRQVTHRSDGQLGMVMTIHTFGEYMGYNCHLHALVADGLFSPGGMFYVAPRVSTKPLEQMFRVRVIKMLVDEELLAEEIGAQTLQLEAQRVPARSASGGSVHNGKPVKRNDTEGLERVAQYIIRLRPSGYAVTRPQSLLRAEDDL